MWWWARTGSYTCPPDRIQGPHPHVHILPCPYYTRAWRGDSLYSRGERGEDVVGILSGGQV